MSRYTSSGEVTPNLTSPVRAKKGTFQNNGRYDMLGGTTINHPHNDQDTDTPTSSNCPSFMTTEKTCRIVNRDNGRTNINYTGTTSKWLGFLTDHFTTLVNSPWYMVGLIFTGTYLISWLFFAGLWIMVAKLDGNDTCLTGINGGIKDFTGATLFSMETQLTIGYGNVYVSNDCVVGLVVMMFQCVIGLILDALLLGLLFTKITRPRSRRKTMIFSDKAVMYEKDGVHYIEFRIGNLRKSQIAECHVRLVLYWYRELNGRYVFEQYDLQCGYETGQDRVVLLTPTTIKHKIDQCSPLWDIPFSQLEDEDLEIVVVLEGVVEATGLTLQALWSYTAREVVQGRELRSIMSRENGNWVVDFRRFNEIITCETEV